MPKFKYRSTVSTGKMLINTYSENHGEAWDIETRFNPYFLFYNLLLLIPVRYYIAIFVQEDC